MYRTREIFLSVTRTVCCFYTASSWNTEKFKLFHNMSSWSPEKKLCPWLQNTYAGACQGWYKGYLWATICWCFLTSQTLDVLGTCNHLLYYCFFYCRSDNIIQCAHVSHLDTNFKLMLNKNVWSTNYTSTTAVSLSFSVPKCNEINYVQQYLRLDGKDDNRWGIITKLYNCKRRFTCASMTQLFLTASYNFRAAW